MENADGSIGGGQGFWSVELTGLDNAVSNIKPSAAAKPSPSSSSTSSPKASTSDPSAPSPKPKPAPSPDTTQNAAPSVITSASTIVVTAPGQTKASSGPNKAVIAAGVVVGVAVVGIIAGGLFFCLRHRRRSREEELNQNAENPFSNNNNLPSSSASMSDSRLEPSVMMQRRPSDGSIADNQDYSRRILKVHLVLNLSLALLVADVCSGDESGWSSITDRINLLVPLL